LSRRSGKWKEAEEAQPNGNDEEGKKLMMPGEAEADWKEV
jgi:hypothetical protein